MVLRGNGVLERLVNWIVPDYGPLNLMFTYPAIVVGLVHSYLPYMILTCYISLEAIDDSLIEAARSLGAKRLTVLRRLILPLALPGILAGAVLGFAKALGEFGATISFVSNIPGETQTLSLAIYALLQSPDGDAAALRLIGVSVAIALLAVIASEWLARRMRQADSR